MLVVSYHGLQAQTWVALNSGTNVEALRDIFFTDANTGYVVGGYPGVILKTTDAGGHWVALNPGITEQLASIWFTDPNTGYAVGGNQTPAKLLKTTDAGNTWSLQEYGSWNRLYSVQFVTPSIGYTAGVVGTLLKTTNAGGSWFPLSAGTSQWFVLPPVSWSDLDEKEKSVRLPHQLGRRPG
jgi:photosystem II stability/assembly factor-like uncharacterized protein